MVQVVRKFKWHSIAVIAEMNDSILCRIEYQPELNSHSELMLAWRYGIKELSITVSLLSKDILRKFSLITTGDSHAFLRLREVAVLVW